MEWTGSLSVHQMVAYLTAVSTYEIVKTGKPTFIAEKIKIRNVNCNTRHGVGTVQPPDYTLNIAREGFIYRGATIFNKLEESLRIEPKLEKFKAGVKKWVKKNIAIKPKPYFPSISTISRSNQPPAPPKPPHRRNMTKRNPSASSSQSSRRNSIRNYFFPVIPAQPAVSRPCLLAATATGTTATSLSASPPSVQTDSTAEITVHVQIR